MKKTARFFINCKLMVGGTFTLTPELSFYLFGVLRKRQGQTITLFNGDGGEYQSVVRSLEKRSGEVEILSRSPNLIPLSDTHLLQPLLSQEKMDLVIQKACELGVNTIQPVVTEFCSAKWVVSKQVQRLAHWKKVLISACEQSGRGDIPNIYPPKLVGEVLDIMPLCCVFHPGEAPLCEVDLSKSWFFVGPEGGFSDGEITICKQAGATVCSLGPRILRTETASMAVLSRKLLLY